MTQKKPISEHNAEKLFKEMFKYSDKHGISALIFKLQFISGQTFSFPNENKELNEVFFHIDYCTKNFAFEYLYGMFRAHKQNHEIVFPKDQTEEIINEIYETVSDVYLIDKNGILNDSKKSGLKIYASGTTINLFLDVLNLPIDAIKKITGKLESLISRHKHTIIKLDHKHPFEKKILIKYLTCKSRIIKTITDGKKN